jgi:hypothetical protein
MQGQFSLLRSRRFNPIKVYTDPQSALLTLRNHFPGIEFDGGGAGDHNCKVDIRIRRIKELYRSQISSLKFPLPDSKVKDLVAYSVSRLNIRRTTALTNNISPRVAFTGTKVHEKELSLAFGDYVEVLDPSAESRNAEVARTEPCIALYPLANSTGSWTFWNLKTNTYVRRSRWVPVKLNEDIIKTIMRIYNEERGRKTVQPVEQPPAGERPAALAEPVQPTTEETEEQPANVQESPPEAEAAEVDPSIGEPEPEQPEARRSERIREGIRAPSRFSHHTSTNANASSPNISVRRALKLHGEIAEVAVEKELRQLFETKKALKPVMPEVAKSKDTDPVGGHCFLKEKFDAAGNFDKMKARLVGDGRTQNRELYDVASPTVAMKSVFIALAIAAAMGAFVAKIDIAGAYLNADMNEELYMRFTPELVDITLKIFPEFKKYQGAKGELFVQVLKALYGFVQSAKLWRLVITSALKELGYTHNPVDPCVMHKKSKNGAKHTILIYVDDMLLIMFDLEEMRLVIRHLKSKFEDLSVEMIGKEPFSYLGMLVQFIQNGVVLDMKAYIESILRNRRLNRRAHQPTQTFLNVKSIRLC